MKRLIIPLATVLVAVATLGSPLAGSSEATALDGYCPVAYVAAGKAIKGDPELWVNYGGRHYVFANADAKAMFEKDPAKFRVAYDGYCATAASMGKKVESDPAIFTNHDGVTYRFSSDEAQKMFEDDAAAIIARADAEWPLLEPAYGGHCPVAYTVMGKAVAGDPEIALDYQGRLILFAGADAKKMFEADPDKYTVAYDGYCATAVAMGKRVESDPAIFTVHDGVTYLFSSAEAKTMFDADPGKTIAKANEQWAALTRARAH